MSTFEQELESSAELLKCGKISKEQGRAHARSLAWFRAHAAQLAEAGWTVPELYRVGPCPSPILNGGPAG